MKHSRDRNNNNTRLVKRTTATPQSIHLLFVATSAVSTMLRYIMILWLYNTISSMPSNNAIVQMFGDPNRKKGDRTGERRSISNRIRKKN